jgi:predicted component of type VI protein secretion system
MKKIKRLAAVLLAGIMALALFTACSASSTPASHTSRVLSMAAAASFLTDGFIFSWSRLTFNFSALS